MKTLYLAAPYWMGDFNPARAGVIRHNWRIMPPISLAGQPTARMGQLCAALAGAVAEVRGHGQVPVVIGGDCTFSIGVAAALQRESPDFTLVWYDAHGDFNTHETTPSGFIGGMPLAMLCGRGEQTILSGAGATPHPEARVILTDARDLDPGEKEAVAGSAITHLAEVADLLNLPLAETPLYVHFDCDVLRLADMAAVNYPAAGGSSLETIDASLRRLAQTGRVAAVSLTMWDPTLDDPDRQAEQVVMGLIERFVEQL
jgi:arginase